MIRYIINNRDAVFTYHLDQIQISLSRITVLSRDRDNSTYKQNIGITAWNDK